MNKQNVRKIKHRKGVPEIYPADVGLTPASCCNRLFKLDDGRVLDILIMITGHHSTELEVSEIVFQEDDKVEY